MSIQADHEISARQPYMVYGIEGQGARPGLADGFGCPRKMKTKGKELENVETYQAHELRKV